MKNTQQEIKLENQAKHFLSLSICLYLQLSLGVWVCFSFACSSIQQIQYVCQMIVNLSLCTIHMHKFIAFAHDISTVKAFRNFSHLKRLRLRIDDAFSGRNRLDSFSPQSVLLEGWQGERFHQNQKTTRLKRKTKSNQKTLLSKREIKLNVLFG